MSGTGSSGGAPQGEALSAAIDSFTAAGIPSPRLDAEVILCGITGRDRSNLIASPETTLTPAQARSFSKAVRRRLRREPVAYILGTKGFRHIDLAVDPRVLVPRPETEMLVELALECRPRTMLELGTGSGAISLAVADELPGCAITATDVSEGALTVARANATTLGLDHRIEFVEGSLPESGEFDLILANLPYIAADERLDPDVRDWEPGLALFGGASGYEVFEQVLGDLAEGKVRAPVVGLEIGEGQGERVGELVREAGYEEIELREDLAGIGRVVIGRQGQPAPAA